MQFEYDGADRFMKIHFGGEYPYDASIKCNLGYLDDLLENDYLSLLRRLPTRVIDTKYRLPGVAVPAQMRRKSAPARKL